MKILVNAYNLRSAGGMTVGKNFIHSLKVVGKTHNYLVIIPKQIEFELINQSNITYYKIPQADFSFPKRLLLQKKIDAVISNFQPDKIFSLGNVAWPTKLPQLLMIHWPYLVYPEDPFWKNSNRIEKWKRRLRKYQITKKLQYANVITVQTEVMKSRLEANFSFKKPVCIIPSTGHIDLNKPYINTKISNDTFNLLFLSDYYSHKNFKILPALAELIKKHNLPINIYITLRESRNKEVTEILTKLKVKKLDDIVVNIGPIEGQYVSSLLEQVDGLFLPSLIESFGITYIEALKAKKPIFTSNLDFAKVICGNDAFFFDPFHVEKIFNALKENYHRKDLQTEKINALYTKYKEHPTAEKITQQYINILERIK